jgi:hypothetical protein
VNGYLFALAINRRRSTPLSSQPSLRSALLRSASFSSLLPCDPSLAISTSIAMSSLLFPRRFQSQTQLDSVRRLLGWSAPAQAEKIRAGKIPLCDLAAGEFVLFNSYIMCGLVPPISSSFLLLLEEFGLQLHHLTPHSILLVAVFAHSMEMFVGVRLCTTIFRHFYALVGTGRSKREVDAYYFQLRHGMANSYITAFSSSKWEDWREAWVIAEADPHDRLELPTDGPQSDRSTWKPKPMIPKELDPVLYRVKNLQRSGLTSLMVLGDLLKRRIAPCSSGPRWPTCIQD